MKLQISVIGSSEATPEAMRLAEEVGRELAKRGVTVVTGGLTGVMEAACKGAKEAGGTTIGILPSSDPGEANPYVDIPICTGIGYARNVIVVRSGRAVIAIAGAFGTLSEIAHALSDGIPVIGLNTWSFSQNGMGSREIILAHDPADAVEKALEAALVREKALPASRGAG
ncbi:MAG: hypothetical protein HW388_382 [Dehalococcoidia bacterium]|nr:hypothetical protein [Dehalococcoidia bacterium]